LSKSNAFSSTTNHSPPSLKFDSTHFTLSVSISLFLHFAESASSRDGTIHYPLSVPFTGFTAEIACFTDETRHFPFHIHRHYQWHYSPESGLGLPYGFRDDITMWAISPTSDLVLVILIRPPETSSGEATIDI
jgi:hypothetical protein